MTHEGRAAFSYIKGPLAKSSQLVIIHEKDLLILFTNSSTKAIGGVLKQLQNEIEKPVIFVSIIISLTRLLVGESWSWNSMLSYIIMSI